MLARTELFALASAIEVACSDDETEGDDGGPPLSANTAPSIPRSIRQLPWRRLPLHTAMVGVDNYRTRVSKSVPKHIHGHPP